MAEGPKQGRRPFMEGRYGMDELGQSLVRAVFVVLILGVICSFATRFLGDWIGVLARVLNILALVLIVYCVFRVLSRDIPRRMAENERHLDRKKDRDKKKAKERAKDTKNFLYLECPFCGQEMRVPKGKGKIAVKCPKCGEKTIAKS